MVEQTTDTTTATTPVTETNLGDLNAVQVNAATPTGTGIGTSTVKAGNASNVVKIEPANSTTATPAVAPGNPNAANPPARNGSTTSSESVPEPMAAAGGIKGYFQDINWKSELKGTGRTLGLMGVIVGTKMGVDHYVNPVHDRNVEALQFQHELSLSRERNGFAYVKEQMGRDDIVQLMTNMKIAHIKDEKGQDTTEYDLSDPYTLRVFTLALTEKRERLRDDSSEEGQRVKKAQEQLPNAIEYYQGQAAAKAATQLINEQTKNSGVVLDKDGQVDKTDPANVARFQNVLKGCEAMLVQQIDAPGLEPSQKTMKQYELHDIEGLAGLTVDFSLKGTSMPLDTPGAKTKAGSPVIGGTK